ncbi:MAG: aromatic ring-hydroxylating oxygenase subunit alpha [Acidimicrobiia bacterium]
MSLTLPASWYRDPAVYERERQAVWRSEWLMYAPAAKLATPGHYVAEEVAGYPVFVVVDPDGSLRGYHNVCPHRAGVIVWPGAGTAGNLVCRYHGWAFGWDGELKAARDFGDDPGLCPEENSLVPIHVERWRNLVFVHLGGDPPPLTEAIGPFAAECESFDMEAMTYGHRLVRVLDCNWKTYADNYLEGYHVPLIHPSLSRALDMTTYRVDVPDESYCIHRSDTTEGSPAGGAWLFRYPNLAVNVYADGMNVERIVPVGHATTHVVYDYFARDLDQIEAMVEMSNVVLDEDQAMCEAVQRNLDAGVYEAGRLSPKHEASVGWFQRRVATALGERP